MANRAYLDLAKLAGENEREYEWGMACELWLQAASKAPENSTDKFWALLRSDFCRCRGREHGMFFVSETPCLRDETRAALRGLSRLHYLQKD